MDSIVPARLLDCRRDAKLSQEEAAYRVGTTQGTLSRWERGATEPSFSDLAALARTYGVQRWMFFMDDEQVRAIEFAERLLAQARLGLAATGTDGPPFRQIREHDESVSRGRADTHPPDYRPEPHHQDEVTKGNQRHADVFPRQLVGALS